MSDQKKFDFIIAGAGAAGLSLVRRMLDSPILKNRKILVIDQSFKPSRDKTWCFWEDFDLPDTNLIYHTWNKLLVRINGQTYSETLTEYRYNCLRSDDFSSPILEQAKEHPNVTFLEADILDFSGNKNTATVHTSNGDFNAEYIFQSVKKPPNFEKLKVDISLIQHFLGWEIESEKDFLAPETATFMDFEVPQKNGVSFMYLLPFSEKKALAEYTVFSKKILAEEEYQKEISDYLEKNYQLKESDYTIKRKEFGAIPMEDRRYPAWYCKNVLNMGTIAGLSKPSTGYTFSRIQKHSTLIINALEQGKKLPQNQSSSYRFRVYDLMMLYLLACETGNSRQVFFNLFDKYSFELVLKFLAEETNPIEEIKIFSGMPYRPFFRSIYKMKHRIFTGA